MPFTKVGKNSYVSPSGRHYDEAQVRLWYANGGKFPGQKTSELPTKPARKRRAKNVLGK